MVRADRIPWEPGIIVLTLDDLRGKNPYNGGRLTAQAIMQLMPAIGQACLESDTCITIVQAQSKHL